MLALIDARSADLPVLLLVRSGTLSSHPGQVALPGGGPAAEDGPLWRTALREAWEELGVPEEAVDLRGRASVVETPNSRYVISTYVGLLRADFKLLPAAAEVDDWFWFPLRPKEGPLRSERRRMRLRLGPREMPGFAHGERFVWGATGAIVSDLLRRLGD
ncbi:MAG: NUDIX hydrolase [Candidatus Dormibacteria bacterium]